MLVDVICCRRRDFEVPMLSLTAALSLGGNLSGSGSKLAPPETPQKLDLTRAVTSGNDCKVLEITATSVQARRLIPDRK